MSPKRPTVRQIRRGDDPDEPVQICCRVPRWAYRSARHFGAATGQTPAAVLRAWIMDAAEEQAVGSSAVGSSAVGSSAVGVPTVFRACPAGVRCVPTVFGKGRTQTAGGE
jgi:hypothetical protein